MQEEGIIPDAVTYIGILKACGSIGCLGMREEIHEEVKKQDLLGIEVPLGTALVNMYAKCDVLRKAYKYLVLCIKLYTLPSVKGTQL